MKYPSAHPSTWSPGMSGQLSLKKGVLQSTVVSTDYKMLSQLPRRISAQYDWV